MTTTIPAPVNTDLEKIPSIAATVRASFHKGTTKPIEYRLGQLRKLYWSIKDNADLIAQACQQDLGKGTFETYLCETGWCLNDIVFVNNNLKKWMKDESAPDVSLINKAMSPTIRKDPLGAVYIIGTYNFPFQLTLGPLIGAIAAGCTAVLKPSEAAPNAAAVVQRIVESALDPSSYAIVQGGIPESSALLNEKWDKIFYTGGHVVGKIVAKKAAETLTPVTLELGGRNPAIVTKNADIHLAARRLLWGKTMNAGQVCVSQNYIMVDETVLDTFIAEMKKAIAEFFPSGVQSSKDFGRQVNDRSFQRLKKMLEASQGRILIGGGMDEATRYIEPTVVQVNSTTDSMLIDESFGPLIPVLPVKDLDSAIRIANEVSGTPLGLYPFGNKRETTRILAETRSGGATVNDAFFHACIPTIPFGGVGESGQGAYRGRASFDTFVHRRTIVSTPNWIDFALGMRYPPFNDAKLKQFKATQDLSPNFDRDGKTKFSILRYVLTLGGASLSSGLFRWLTIALLSIGWQKYGDEIRSRL